MNYLFLSAFLLTFILSSKAGEYKYYTLKEHRASQKFIAVDGGKMAYIDVGKGEPILLLHGVPTSSWLYRHIIDSLSKKGFRVIAPDLLGFGNSDKPKGYDVYDEKKQAQRIFTLMDSLKIKQWHQTLHDAGGLWTWEMLTMHHERIKSLIILNTITNRDGFNPPFSVGKHNPIGKFSIRLYGSRIFGKRMIKKTLKFGLTYDNITKADVHAYWVPMHEGAYRPVFHFFSNIKETCHNLDAILLRFKEYNIPTIIIWGEKDDILEGKKQIPHLALNLNIPDDRIVLLENGTHFIQEEQFSEIAAKITAFIIPN